MIFPPHRNADSLTIFKWQQDTDCIVQLRDGMNVFTLHYNCILDECFKCKYIEYRTMKVIPMLKPMDGKSLNKWIINLQIQQMHSWLIPSGMKQVSHVLAYYSWYLCHTTLFMNGLSHWHTWFIQKYWIIQKTPPCWSRRIDWWNRSKQSILTIFCLKYRSVNINLNRTLTCIYYIFISGNNRSLKVRESDL